MANIVILDGYTTNPGDNPWTAMQSLGQCTIYDRTPPELVIERAKHADILLTNKCNITAAVIDALPDLKYISLLATGYNNVDVQGAAERGIPVSNIPEFSTESVAQTIMALLLELAVRVGAHDRDVKNGEWISSPDYCFWKGAIVELYGLTMGIGGYGNIGRAVARIASAYGMRIIAYAPRIPADPGTVPATLVSLEELFESAAVISLTCPQTSENAGFVNSELISRMKPSAFLLNAARGGLVNEVDLAEALQSGRLAGAGLDVVAHEPMLAENPLLKAPNVIFTPHIAGRSLAARTRLMKTAVANVSAFLSGKPVNVVNQQYLP
jgi:glycerate dehydrogenase